MLKLTQALNKQADQVYHRLSQYLSKNSDLLSSDELTTTLNPTIVKGLFELIHTTAMSSEMSTYPLAAQDSLNVDRQDLGSQGLEICKAYLRTLSSSDTTVLFLTLEKIVMNSGKGQLFQTWREAWQRCLVTWLKQIEKTQRLKEQLSALLPLSELQTQLLSHHHLDLKMLSQKVADYFSGYLEGRGALSQQLVILLNPNQHIAWDLISLPVQELIQKNLLQAKQELFGTPLGLEQTKVPVQLVAQPSCVFFTITEFLKIILSNQKSQDYPLIHSLIYGRSVPKLFARTPSGSLRLWLLRECRTLLQTTVNLPSNVLITHAENLSQAEFSFWAEILESLRCLDKPFALFLQTKNIEFYEGHEALFFFKRRQILCEVFSETQGGIERSKLSERLSSWDQRWSLALLGYYQSEYDAEALKRDDLPVIDFDLWLSATLKLAPELQALLCFYLSPLSTYLPKLELFDRSWLCKESVWHTHLNTLMTAGWIKQIGSDIRSTTELLVQVVEYLVKTPKYLAETLPKTAFALLSLSSDLLKTITGPESQTSVHHQGGLSFDLDQYQLHQLRQLTQWLQNLSQACDLGASITLKTVLKGIAEAEIASGHQDLNISRLIESCSQKRSSPLVLNTVDINSATLFEYQEEVASVAGDLELLAKVFKLRAYWTCQRDLLVSTVDDLANAHQIFCELSLDDEAFECRASFILLLAQSGLVDLAKPLLNMEYNTLDFCQVDESLAMIAGIVAAQRNEWTLALTHFSGINDKTDEVLIWEAVSSLKSISELSSDPKVRQKLYQQVALQLTESLKSIKLSEMISFDLCALYTWIEVLLMVILKHTSNFQALYQRLLKLSQYPELSRGHLYCVWTSQCLEHYAHSLYAESALLLASPLDFALSPMIDDLKALKQKLQGSTSQVHKAWHNGYGLLLAHLQDDTQVLNKLISPHCYNSQQRSVTPLPQSRNMQHLKLWELSESGDLELFVASKP